MSAGDRLARREKLFGNIKKRLPDNQQILSLARSEMQKGEMADETRIIAAPSEFVANFQRTAYAIYKVHEQAALAEGLAEYAVSRLKFPASETDVREFFDRSADDFNEIFLSLSQSRKSRAGAALEHVVEVMFRAAGVPFESARLLNGKPDFILPSKEHYDRNPTDCLIVTVKQTLRERWRQVTTEGHRARKVYLITIDAAVKTADLSEMNLSGITLVVPAALKKNRYDASDNVISFEYFFEHFLRPGMRRWAARR